MATTGFSAELHENALVQWFAEHDAADNLRCDVHIEIAWFWPCSLRSDSQSILP